MVFSGAMAHKIRKAVIPAAGLGTRFLPATKTVPKEMLTIVDKPILLYVVEEAARAGIEDIVLVQGRGKAAIEDFFDTSFELEAALEKSGRLDLLQNIQSVKQLANVISVRQKTPLGLGHAVLTAKPVVGDDPFALLLGDEIMLSAPNHPTAIGQLANLYEEKKLSTVAIMKVADDEVSKYGIVAGDEMNEPLFRVRHLVEKPDPKESPSRWAMPGRYVFDSKIFHYLTETSAGKNGEIQLTDAMVKLAKNEGLWASVVQARRYDAGDRLGYIQANLALALEHPDLREGLIQFINDLNLPNFGRRS